MQFSANNGNDTSCNVAMNLDLFFPKDINRYHYLQQMIHHQPFESRGMKSNKRCLEEIEDENNNVNKKSRSGSENLVETMPEGKINSKDNTTNNFHTNMQPPPPPPTTHIRTTHFIMDTKMTGYQNDSFIEYPYYLDRNAYGYRDH